MDPATLSMIASLIGKAAPFILGAFADGQESPEAAFERIYALLQAKTASARSAAIRSATASGAALAQNFEVASSGAGASTGVGAAARGMAQSYAGNVGAETALKYDTALASEAGQLASTGAFAKGPSRFDTFLGALAPMLAEGNNPFEQAATSVSNWYAGRQKPAAPPPATRNEYFNAPVYRFGMQESTRRRQPNRLGMEERY